MDTYLLSETVENDFKNFTKSADDRISQLVQFLHNKQFSIKNTNSSYRTINSWDELELIGGKRDSLSEWRKFSLVDLIWIQTMIHLRSFGLSTEQLLTTKESLLDKKPLLFEYFIHRALRHELVALIVGIDGTAHLDLEENVKYNQMLMNLNDYIHINFYDLVYEFVSSPKIELKLNKNISLSIDEIEVINAIRSKKYSNIQLFTKSGKIERLELSENVSSEKRIVDLLREHEYQEIQLQQAGGKIVSLKRIIKKK